MLGGDPDTSMSGRRIARKFAELIARRGQPGMIVSDHGTGLVLNAILAWSNDGRWNGYIAPGEPHCRTAMSILKRRMRDELLNESLFFGPDHAPKRHRRMGGRL